MSIPRNVLANYAGQGAAALLALAFIPLYVRKLGVEGYGLIGFYTALYTILGIIDSSIQGLLSRNAAQAIATKDRSGLADRVRTLEIILGGFGMALIGVFSLIASPVSDGIKRAELSSDTVAFVLQMISLVLALRLFEGLYRACLMGLERQVLFNGIFIISQCLRWAGAAVIVTWYSATVEAFFVWQAVAAVTSALMLGTAAYRSVGAMQSATIQWRTLWQERRFLAGMAIISGMAVLLTQTDKLLLVKLLPLAEFGDYALAATAAGAVMLLVGPVADAIYPRLVQAWTKNDMAAFADHFHLGAQWVTVTVGVAVCAGIVFAQWILSAWTNDPALTQRVTPLFQILLLGNLLNAFMWIPYRAQLATGWTGLAARINLVAVICLVPAILVVVPIFGAVGAAWVWVVLNAGYVFIGAQCVFRKLLSNDKLQWYHNDLAKPVVAAAMPIWILAMLTENAGGPILQLLITIIAAMIGGLTGFAVIKYHNQATPKPKT